LRPESASEILRAYDTGTMLPAPPSAIDPAFDLDAAYAIEAELVRMRRAQGRRTVGRKVGFANKAAWRILKLETLVWAHMYDNTVRHAVNNDATLSIAGRVAPRIEPEIVFKLARPLGPGADGAAALAAVEWMALGFEINDCVFPEWKFTPPDFVAAFGFHVALVVGAPQRTEAPAAPREDSESRLRQGYGGLAEASAEAASSAGARASGGRAPRAVNEKLASDSLLDALAAFTVTLSKNGAPVETGSGKNALRSPALCLAELATAISRRPGAEPLAAGELVSTGTLTTPQPVAAGEVWRADVAGLDLPPLTLTFT
jgi:2-oxo-3-hexenedioate decarboxylase